MPSIDKTANAVVANGISGSDSVKLGKTSKPLEKGEKTGTGEIESEGVTDEKKTESAGEQDPEKKEEEEKIPAGTLAEFKPLFQKKDNDGKYQWSTQEPEDVEDAAETSETAKFAFLVRNKKSYDSRKKYEIDSIIVQSQLLKDVLGIAFKEYPGITTNLKRLVFKAPFQPFVHRWSQLTDLLQSSEGETQVHLKLFYDVLFAELKDAISAKNDLVKNGVITFEFLWTIMEPGTLIYSTDEGKERVYELNSSATAVDQRRGMEFLRLYVWGVDWDGEKFGSSYEYLSDYEFEGTIPITSLAAFPLIHHPHRKQLIEKLVLRGKIFERYAGYHYQAYKGVALGYGRCGLIKYNVDSRIIIDCAAHNAFLPDRAVYFNALGVKGSAAIQNGVDDDETVEDEDSTNYSDEEESFTPDSGDTSAVSKTKHRALTAKELLLAVPYVRGYAIKTKRWLIFFLENISAIKFADNAFSSLVLPQAQKDLIRAFVESQVKYKDTFDDVIAGKGRGMIMLLSGPPGVGKTLTAESVAENMRAPLYMMSAGDLGLDPSGIEQSLNTVLEMVAKWNAVLLLDEADVFLEARSSNDLERNKMVSIFLRVLEYYEGILFLTTNRITNIDDAFHSRIHVSMRYPNLTAESRRQIWATFMGGTAGVSSKDLDKLAQVELNGRQIKNVLKTAQMLCRSQRDGMGVLGMKHIETILAIERGKAWN